MIGFRIPDFHSIELNFSFVHIVYAICYINSIMKLLLVQVWSGMFIYVTSVHPRGTYSTYVMYMQTPRTYHRPLGLIE